MARSLQRNVRVSHSLSNARKPIMQQGNLTQWFQSSWNSRAGKISYAVVLWLLGAPGLLILIALFARGCGV